MWDRRGTPTLPGASAAVPGSRSMSPLPRRSSSARSPYVTSQRPGIGPRSSSLSLASNDSSTSLLSTSRRPNGSTLKQTTIVDDGSSTVAALQHLLGAPSTGIAPAGATNPAITEDDLDFEPDFAGLSLQELGRADDVSIGPGAYRPQSAEEYEREKERFEDLHRSIQACDDILSSVESNLTSFRNDLAAVSADIESLQARSEALNVRLQNRKAVEKGLGPIVEEICVSPAVVSRIAEGHIDESWIKALAELDKRVAAYHNNSSSRKQSRAFADLGPLLEKLVLKAVERIRDFLVAQIKALRSPSINAQIIQQQNFLKFKELYSFLHKHHANLASEISQAYQNTIRWYYETQFTLYRTALEKVRLHVLDKNDVIGHEDTSRSRTVLSSGRIGGPPHDAFNLGRRIDILKTNSQSALTSYLAEEDQATHYLEVPFRNFNLALMDNATAEYIFLESFFAPLSHSAIAKNFNYIFERTFALGQDLTKALISETYDCLGLLLCVRLNQHFAFELQRRKVAAVEGYINATNMLLWPRLQSIMNDHCSSVRALTTALPVKSTAAAAKQQSAAPHVVTQRFGQLLHGILALSTESGDDEPIINSLRRLRSEAEAFLTKHSRAYFGNDKRKRERFLYNNYSLILTIIGDLSGKLADEQQQHFENLKTAFQEDA